MMSETTKLISTGISIVIIFILIATVLVPIIHENKLQTEPTYKTNDKGKYLDNDGAETTDLSKAVILKSPLPGAKTINAIMEIIPLLLTIGAILLVSKLFINKN